MDFESIGEMALGSRLRALSKLVTDDAERIYELYGTNLKPKWFPVFYFLSNQNEPKPVTAIARGIGQSHPSVIKIIREMSKANLVEEQKDKSDGRVNNILLTRKGLDISLKIQDQYTDVEKAIREALNQTTHNIWLALQEFEYILNEKSLYQRVSEQKKTRESMKVEIIPYSSKYHTDFKQLNEEWIKKYFKIEESDRKVLDHPEENILSKGGDILVAVLDNTVLGVCALIKMEDEKYDYELAKMAVSPKAQGKGIGHLLGNAIIDKARSLGASYLYLESNTILKPAISLYQKLGFQKIAGRYTPYERSNIQMELKL